MKRSAPFAAALAVALLAGCVREEPPAPVVDAENSAAQSAAPASALPAPAPVETGGGKLTVRPGQTLYAVARDANVPVRALIDANHLQPPYALQVGQVLIVPRTRQHVVQAGETLYGVAREYGVEASSLARENHLNPPYTIHSGAVLILPSSAEAASAVPAAPPAAAPVAPPAAVPVAPPVVGSAPPPAAAGPSAIAVAPLPPPEKPTAPAGSTPVVPPPSAPPAAAQAIHAPTALQPSDAAANPPPPAVSPPPPSVAAAVPPPPAPAPAAAPPPAPPPPAKPAAAPSPPEPESGAKPAETAESTAAVATAVANHAAPVSPLFLWPVRGRILSVFGTAAGGTHNDGINISAPAGTTVSAAESGTVAYAGNELRGFGNLLLIKHADGWVTAYAHNDVLLVKKGQKVRRGEPIARVGSTGGVGETQLHFELRRGTKAVDPLDHLPPLTADAG